MQLPAGQHTLLAGFRSEEQARGAADELVRLGASAVQVDRVSLWPRGDAARDTRPAVMVGLSEAQDLNEIGGGP